MRRREFLTRAARGRLGGAHQRLKTEDDNARKCLASGRPPVRVLLHAAPFGL